jgi:branched-chain amino acid transport system ATP-binding protein
MGTVLTVKNINVYYGAIHAIKGISFDVDRGEIVTLIGANGAGKSTTLHTVSGLLRSKTGDIEFLGESISHTAAHKIVSKGISHVPEGRRIFQGLTVEENLQMGAFVTKKDRIEHNLEYVYEQFPRLKERTRQIAGTLSGGEQQMLAMGRALMSRPKIVVMDEPSMGLSPILVSEIFDIITSIRKDGTTVLLVEQNAKKALSIADRAYVLETGRITLSGKASDLINDENVKKAYLGE